MEMVSVKSEENYGKRSVEAPEGELQKCIKRRKRDSNAAIAANNGGELAQPSSTTTGGAKRSSRFRGVSRHRWTGRFEAHLWDKGSWNAAQNKKGKQVYLGAYDQEEAAARAYDLAALKYWGPTTFINFPISNYEKDIQLMQNVTKEEYLAFLRRKSSGFSRGVSKYRGVARHHHNGRWEARIGRIFGNKYLYLGTYSTQEEAAAAYDIAAIEYRGINAVTNFDLSTYIRWLRPKSNSLIAPQEPRSNGETQKNSYSNAHPNDELQPFLHSNHFPNNKISSYQIQQCHPLQVSNGMQNKAPSTPTALDILLRSSIFRELVERNSNTVDNGVEVDETEQQQSFVNGNEFGENFYNGISNIPYACSSQTKPAPSIELNGKNASSYFDCTEQSLWSNALSTSIH